MKSLLTSPHDKYIWSTQIGDCYFSFFLTVGVNVQTGKYFQFPPWVFCLDAECSVIPALTVIMGAPSHPWRVLLAS